MCDQQGEAVAARELDDPELALTGWLGLQWLTEPVVRPMHHITK
jgi:hypothetical protein